MTDTKTRPSFDVTRADSDLIDTIAERALALDIEHNGRWDARSKMTWTMDITATHANGCPLRLADLGKADPFNFAHDAFGIARHLDRSTGALTDCFLPRYAATQHDDDEAARSACDEGDRLSMDLRDT